MDNQKPKHELSGRIPPFAVDLEAAVLGAILLEKTALIRAMPLLHTDKIFYLEKHQVIMKAILVMFEGGKDIDILTVSSELNKMGNLNHAGGASYVTELTSAVASSAHLESHIRILQEHWMKRTMIRIGSELTVGGYKAETDAFNLLDALQHQVIKMVEGVDNGRTIGIREALTKALKQVERNMELKDSLTGVPTPFKYLNGLTGGWQKTDLIIIAARPAMGKTALMMTLVRSALQAGQGVGVFSLEMSVNQLTSRLVVQETRVCSAQDLKRGRLSVNQLKDITAKLSQAWDYNLHIDDTPGLSLVDFRAKAWSLKTHHDIQMIVIDYLQLMSGETSEGKTGNREQEISTISRNLKKIAKELEIPIIALSQLSRAVETRGGDKKPMLSDLRESGAIEQDADLIFFLYRAEYYGIRETHDGMPTAGLGELICAKNREGALGTTYMKWQPEYTDFVDNVQDTASLVPPSAKAESIDYEPGPDEYPEDDDMPF